MTGSTRAPDLVLDLKGLEDLLKAGDGYGQLPDGFLTPKGMSPATQWAGDILPKTFQPLVCQQKRLSPPTKTERPTTTRLLLLKVNNF